jgi:hypothetical protein
MQKHLVGCTIIVSWPDATYQYHYVFMEDARREFDLMDGPEPYGWYKKLISMHPLSGTIERVMDKK